MKTLLYTLVLASFIGCSDSDYLQTRIFSFLVDRTENHLTAPTATYLLDRLPNSNPNDALELCYSILGDTPYVQTQCFVLSHGETGLLANEDTRRKEHKLLKSRFADSVTLHNDREYLFERSDIFRPLVSELEKLSEKEGYKELWLFSDLKEHSFFSVYDPNSKRLLMSDLEKVVAIFENEIPIHDDISGIKLKIVHSPSLADSKMFTQLVLLYRNLLEPHGVEIQIGLEDQIRISK